MDIMEAIRKALDMNGYLSKGIKDNIYELVQIMHTKLPEVDLTNLKDRLGYIQFKKINKFISDEVSMYSNVDNILYFNSEKLTEDLDTRHVLMYELLNVASSTNYKKGFSQDGKYEALNVGFTEILTNYLIGNESDKPMHQEQTIETNFYSTMVGPDVMRRAYFTNDTTLLIQGFANVGVRF